MSEESFTSFVRRASLVLAQTRLEAGLGRALDPLEIELCTLEAALLFNKADERKVFETEDELIRAMAAIQQRLEGPGS